MIRIFIAVLGLFFAFSASASASLGDCMDSDYLGNFGSPDAGVDPMSPVRTITCVVEFDIEYASPVGPRRIRGIRDASAAWGIRPGALARVEAGARAAIEAMKELGDFRVADITILILDDSYDLLSEPPDPLGPVAAVTNGNPGGHECYITTFMFGPTGFPEHVAQNTAHEIFHCVQAASLTSAQWGTTLGGGAWWAEGSAEYFAALAVPAAGDILNRAGAFDRAVAEERPLHAQTYGMAVFFYWMHPRFGPTNLMPFLHRMASSSDGGAQRAAMRSVLSDAEWLEFAESYADRSITHPSGAALSFSGDDGDDVFFDSSRTERMTLQPFVLRRGWITFDCGRWENEVRPGGANIGAREESGRDWGPIPSEVEIETGEVERRYRFAALHTQDGAQDAAIEADRIHSCRPCADSRELDRCVMGTWKMSGGGPIEWMKRQGVPIIRDNPGTRIIRFGDDGVYFTQSFATDITVDLEDKVGYGQGIALPAAGRWSIAGGKLAICQDSGGMSGTVTVDGVSMPVAVPGGGTLMHDYSCSATTLQTTQDLGSGPPMQTTYTKIGEPPDEEP